MAPSVAEVDAAERDAARPDRAETAQHGVQDGGRGALPLRRETVEQAAGPGVVGLPERFRVGRDDRAEAVEQGCAALKPDERIAGAGLEPLRQFLGVSAASASASARNGSSGRFENAPPTNRSKLATARPSERANVSPVRPSW